MEKVEQVYNIRPLIRSCSNLGFFFKERTRHSYVYPRRESVIYFPLYNQRTISAVEKLDHMCIPLKYVTVQILKYLFLQHAIRFPQYINVEKSRNPESFMGYSFRYRDCVMLSNVDNASVISWRSVLLLEETGVPGEHHQPAASH